MQSSTLITVKKKTYILYVYKPKTITVNNSNSRICIMKIM